MTERTHTVRNGETLSSLSKQYYGREDFADVIQRANMMASPTVFVGEELKIPEINAPPVSSKAQGRDTRLSEVKPITYEPDPLAGRTGGYGAVASAPPPTKASGFIRGALIAFIVIFGGLFGMVLLVRSSNRGVPDNQTYIERALASCARQYRDQEQINNCAIRLGAEKLYQIEQDKMDAARRGAR
jgi:hypothetical protein